MNIDEKTNEYEKVNESIQDLIYVQNKIYERLGKINGILIFFMLLTITGIIISVSILFNLLK